MRLPRISFSLRSAIALFLLASSALYLKSDWPPWHLNTELRGSEFAVFSPDSKYLAFWDNEMNALQVMDLTSNKVILLEGNARIPDGISFSVEGVYLVALFKGDPFADDTLSSATVWHLPNGKPYCNLELPSSSFDITSLCLHVNSTNVFTRDGSIIWTIPATNPPLELYAFRKGPILYTDETQEHIQQDAQKAVDECLRATNLQSFVETASRQIEFSQAVSMDGKILATHIHGTQQVQFWSLQTPIKIRTVQLNSKVGKSTMWASPNGDRLAIYCAERESLTLLSGTNWQKETSIEVLMADEDSPFFPANGSEVILLTSPSTAPSIAYERKLESVSLETGVSLWARPITLCSGLSNSAFDVQEILPIENNWILEATEFSTIDINDLQSGVQCFSLPVDSNGSYLWSAISPNGKFFVTVNSSDRIQIFTRKRPMPIWGIIWRPSLWITALFAILLIWSIRRRKAR